MCYNKSNRALSTYDLQLHCRRLIHYIFLFFCDSAAAPYFFDGILFSTEIHSLWFALPQPIVPLMPAFFFRPGLALNPAFATASATLCSKFIAVASTSADRDIGVRCGASAHSRSGRRWPTPRFFAFSLQRKDRDTHAF